MLVCVNDVPHCKVLSFLWLSAKLLSCGGTAANGSLRLSSHVSLVDGVEMWGQLSLMALFALYM